MNIGYIMQHGYSHLYLLNLLNSNMILWILV